MKKDENIGKTVRGFEILDVKAEKKKKFYYVKCPFCRDKKWIRADTVLYNEKVVSCGCVNKSKNFLKPADIAGKHNQYKLRAIEPTGKLIGHEYEWKCQCDCGNITYIRASSFFKTKSCGCLRKEMCLKNVPRLKKINDEDSIDGTNIKSITNIYVNKKVIKSNTSGVTGVVWDKSRNKWKAQIVFKGKTYHLGRYLEKKQAIEARQVAEKELFGNFIEWYNENHKNNS